MPIKKRSLPRVEVDWIDSAFHRGWSGSIEKQEKMTVSVCRSVGYLLSRDAKMVRLVMHCADNEESYGDGMSIPTVAVRRIRTWRR